MTARPSGHSVAGKNQEGRVLRVPKATSTALFEPGAFSLLANCVAPHSRQTARSVVIHLVMGERTTLLRGSVLKRA